MVTARHGDVCVVDIFEAGPATTKVQSFTIKLWYHDFQIGSFSPTTHNISVFIRADTRLRIFNLRDLRCLLHESGKFTAHLFSPDGSLFAASLLNNIHIWKYHGGCYTLWKRLPYLDGPTSRPFLFSPNSSSILGHFTDSYRLWRLDGPPVAPATDNQKLSFFSRPGTYVATGHRGESTVTITNLLSKLPPQLIHTGMTVERLVLTDRVLLVMNSTMIRTWRLTEEGAVYGVSAEGTWADWGSSVCTVPLPQDRFGDPRLFGNPELFVEGQTGILVYRLSQDPTHDPITGEVREPTRHHHIYDTRTGEERKPAQEPLHSEPCLQPEKSNYFRHDCVYDNPSIDDWKRSATIIEGEWARGSGEERQFWLPVEWRAKAGGEVDWRPDIAVMRFPHPQDGPIIIKLNETLLPPPPPPRVL